MIELVNTNRAMATARFTIDNIPSRVVLSLVKEKNYWRIFDVEDFSGPGPPTDLRTMLEKEIQKLSSGQSSK